MAAPPIAERHKHHFHRQSPIKESVRVATTANITISTALNNGDSLDGVTLATDDRVLVKDQSTGSQNGIYVVGASPARDYDQSTDDPAFGFLVYVREGTTNGGTVWKNTNTAAPTIGSTSLTFAQLYTTLTDPMTTRGDIIVRNSSNVTARLAIGAAGKILTSDGTDPSWGNGPMTTAGDLIVGGTSGAPARLAKGSDSQVLTVDPTTHLLVWATPSSGFSNPMTTKGDLIVGDTGGSPIRKAVGTDTHVLTADSTATGGMKWAAGGGGGPSDYASGASGTGHLTQPWLAGIPDPPAGGSDDEFDATDTSDPITGWTTLQTPTTIDTNSTRKSHLYLKRTAVNSSAGHVGIYKTWSPSAGQYVETWVEDAVINNVSFMVGAMLFIAEAGATGKFICLRIIYDGSAINLRVTAYNSKGTPTTDLAGGKGGDRVLIPPIGLRIVYNSSTSVSYYFSKSRTDKLWTPALLAANPSFTIGIAGVAIDTQQATTDGEAIFDYVRFG